MRLSYVFMGRISSASLRRVAIPAMLAGLSACAWPGGEHTEPMYVDAGGQPLTILRHWPHDAHSFTEGLLVDGPRLYESTGEYGASRLQMIDWRNGKVLASRALAADRFGEGLARLGNKLYQLTWKSGVGTIYDATTLNPTGDFHYDGEGWGLASDGHQLIMSNGSATLTFLSPESFERTRTLTVRENGQPVDQLNELEVIHGQIWANIWHSDSLLVINPVNGTVLARINGHSLRTALASNSCDSACVDHAGALNGIAFDDAHDRLLLTGKNWPVLFEVALPPLNLPSAEPSIEP